ncbi:DUF2333 family protein [Suttonella ornithocola]|uniref:Uncharacterized protein conserved in bacteria n=1 Tax=Suttonella ornithocola TaxID=279832 RepID=A0A380MSB2_9GAMM|nr:DUF2333 family protein [Suttonella ornithocola]SUO95519.1 Uncharacterized protein conserved in bacteria [Suttonella ornithocola]
MSLKSQSVKGAKKFAGLYHPKTIKSHGWGWRIGLLLFTLFIINGIVMMWWSREPAQFDVNEAAVEYLPEGTQPVVGSAFVGSTIKILDTLLHKPGGFIKNDRTPPGIFMDNIPSWEYGVIMLVRQTTQVLYNDFSRSQSQSSLVKALSEADNNMRIDSSNWMFPAPESKYEDARQHLISYAKELTDGNPHNANFYARADNLNAYFSLVSKTLGDLTQELSTSVGDVIIQDPSASNQAKEGQVAPQRTKTSWWKIDNNFYRARGYAWALLQELRAIRVDFKATLEKKGAMASLDQIINELEKTQKTIWSPMIMNGRGFGFTANHSLVMASYLSRANAALIELQDLLRNG